MASSYFALEKKKINLRSKMHKNDFTYNYDLSSISQSLYLEVQMMAIQQDISLKTHIYLLFAIVDEDLVKQSYVMSNYLEPYHLFN